MLAMRGVVRREGGGGRRREKWMLSTPLDKLHMQCWHISIRTAMCTSSCPLSLLSCIPICHSTPGHGHMPSAWPVDQHCSSLAWQLTMHTYTHTQTPTHSSSDRWVKRWATSCVKWTEGRGVVSNYGETDCKERQTRVCVCVCVCVCVSAQEKKVCM